MIEYTPTTEQIRYRTIVGADPNDLSDDERSDLEEFDRWLAQVEREAAARALEEFADQMATGHNPETLNAERRAIKREARARAAEIREGGTE